MGLLKHLRSRSRLKSQQELGPYPKYPARDLLYRLPRPVLERIFSNVAPHTQDETYEVSERSLIGNSCILCDLRDLSKCVQVCRVWKDVAQKSLYHSVRIDAVHYCSLEQVLSDRRKRKHLDPLEIPATRLHLFRRTLRISPELACQVQYLKLPYTTRETCKAEISRIVSLLPNLRYLDLPESFYSADASCQILRESLQANCSDLRKMNFDLGSEGSFESMAYQRWWTSLEVVNLMRLDVELIPLRQTLTHLPVLRSLNMSQLPRVDDSIFLPVVGVPDFPALQELHIDTCPAVTGAGIDKYVSRIEVSENLNFLSLSHTGVSLNSLASILSKTTCLLHLSFLDTVSKAIMSQHIPPLASQSLRILSFEIISANTKVASHNTQLAATSYYPYLAASIKSNCLPSLRKIYVRDNDFPGQLLNAPSISHNQTIPLETAMLGFNQSLEIYTKGDSEPEWVCSSFRSYSTDSQHHFNENKLSESGSHGRAVNLHDYGMGLAPQWADEARKSIMVGNGAGGFLLLPSDSTTARSRKETATTEQIEKSLSSITSVDERRSRSDLWR